MEFNILTSLFLILLVNAALLIDAIDKRRRHREDVKLLQAKHEAWKRATETTPAQ